MISVKEADQIISCHLKSFPAIKKSFSNCLGNILHEAIIADRDMPPFNKSLLDGIAISFDAWQKGERSFLIEGVQGAGHSAAILKSKNNCFEIMTGAVLPEKCDCVIPVEAVTIKEGVASLKQGLKLKRGQNIRFQGDDHKKGERLLEPGILLDPPQISIAASVGKSVLKVNKKVKVAIISTGDEIVSVDALSMKPYQIRSSNSYFINAALDKTRLFESTIFHLPDNKSILLKRINNILEKFDVVIVTGGVSMGKFDYVPQVLKELGVKVLFHKVQQKPGKPFWFGTNKESKPVFALPGNPVSTQVMMYRYVIPHLKRVLGLKRYLKEYVWMKENYEVKTDFTFFLPVQVVCSSKGILESTPLKTGGSGDFASLGRSDGFIEIPPGVKVKRGSTFSLYRW